MTPKEEVEIDHLVGIAQEPTMGFDILVQRLKGDPAFLGRVYERLYRYDEMAKVNRMDACWLSRRADKTLRAALDTFNSMGVP